MGGFVERWPLHPNPPSNGFAGSHTHLWWSNPDLAKKYFLMCPYGFFMVGQ